ncbi:addiction module RelE/StbE family toxin [Rhizobium rhizoryzae]|uniref:Addiction module RelE/StbE family toxin n=1 Tax=Rhizobium rhizoryzae TaxID=451876 RepID=A0A7W6LGM0_9HYPH|nr:type II toxin-antitoxin system RelE/ParE family toxin [Rhizobium rhizoryzae]MBB4144019.1 addiction module RelE/StbE family toxin [Rhizobium rhizoryzae]
MSVKIVWTRRYLRELEAIGDFVAERNPRAVAQLVRVIHSRIEQLLSNNPFAGRIGEIPGTRELVISATSYIVAYRVNEEAVEILFVQHGGKAWPDEV